MAFLMMFCEPDKAADLTTRSDNAKCPGSRVLSISRKIYLPEEPDPYCLYLVHVC